MMFREWKRHWRVGRARKLLWVRFSCSDPKWHVIDWIIRGMPWRWWNRPVEMELLHRPGLNHECYCRDACETEFRLCAFGIAISVCLSRAWTKRPCSCDKIVWLLCPDNHVEEIEEYGLDRLKAEFPGVNPIHPHAEVKAS